MIIKPGNWRHNYGGGAIAHDSLATVTADPNTGYAFTNWTEGGVEVSKSSSYQFTMAGNRVLVANLKLIPPAQFAVVLSSLPVAGGTTDGSGAFNAGSTVTVSADPNAKYIFINWTENGVEVSKSSSYQFVITQNRKLIANFKLIPPSQFALTLKSNPTIGGSTTGSGAYASGTNVTVTANANPGYNFTSWSGDASGSANPLTVTMTGNKHITANFTLIVVIPPPSLGSVAQFGAFGGNAGITNQGLNTVINNGSIGTTAASTLITGFHDGTTAEIYTETPLNKGNVTGRIYTAPPAPGTATSFAVATQGLADAIVAYNSISPASKPGGSDPGAGELGGLTLAPGVYKSAGSTFKITNGDLTLDAKGDPNAVWIFQTAAGLTVGVAGPNGAKSVVLINGAKAKNVFWYVGSAAVINAAGGGTMTGTIISSAGITFSTAGNAVQTVLNGRAISLVASVTMVNTTINVPQ
ncbi:ice-binding family protein [Mucilaginibacter sp. UYNi724]